MSFILDICTAVPQYAVSKEEVTNFYSGAINSIDKDFNSHKIALLAERTKINRRYSCIPDFNSNTRELYTDGNYEQPVEKRTAIYKEKILPLAASAIDRLLEKTGMVPQEITHIITVSCTGLFAPGFEFLIAEKYGLQHTEKLALNFLGCYAALKALKHASYIAQADPHACILIVCAELCSLHFYPSVSAEDIVANMLFADGAAAMLVCGNEIHRSGDKFLLNIDQIGSAYIPNTMDLMTWNISSSAFRMYLSKHIVNALKENIRPVITDFLGKQIHETGYWAIHPGGIKIIEAVEDSLQLNKKNVADAIDIMQNYGNMSSPTILFILEKIFNKIKNGNYDADKKIFACAFGPGLNIEMISFSVLQKAIPGKHQYKSEGYAVQV